MKYFSSLPLLSKKDNSNNYLLLTNLLTRNYLITSLKNNLMLFYRYDVQEGDTPEGIAYKYYGDPYKYWILFYANRIYNPYSDWPLTSQQLNKHLLIKYRSPAANALNISVSNVTSSQVFSYMTSTVHHYEKIITTTDTENLQTKVIKFNIDSNTYNNLSSSSISRTFSSGDSEGVTVKIDISKGVISIYDYEIYQNESKRTINVMNEVYINQTENEFLRLMER